MSPEPGHDAAERPTLTPAPDQPTSLPNDPYATRLPSPEDEAAEPGELPPDDQFPVVPGYEILAELGRGGMGVVYKAKQIGLNRIVALKMILAGEHAGRDLLTRFRTEAEAVARLQHPGIVQIYEINEHHGLPYFSLEYVDGGSLDRKLNGTPLPPKEAAELVEKLARAVQAAHDAGIVHRDLKPANVLLASGAASAPRESANDARIDRTRVDRTRGADATPLAASTPKITDFGLAKQLDADSGQTRSGAILGTPSYMAPEQAAGKTKEIGPATDVYALGAILYECLTGRPPFKAATPAETVMQVINQEPASVTSLQASTPRDLETICHRCLQKDIGKRYESAAALADDLRRFLNGEPIRARPVTRTEQLVRWCRRNPVVAGLALGTAGALLAGAIISLAFGIHAYQKAEDEKKARHQAEVNEALATMHANNTRAEFDRFQVANGLRLIDEGDFYGGLLWFARPLENPQREPVEAELLRVRLSNYWRHTATPTLVRWYDQEASIEHADFSPDGQRIVSAGWGRTAKVWEVSSGRLLTSVVHDDATGRRAILHASFSPDGASFLTAVGQPGVPRGSRHESREARGNGALRPPIAKLSGDTLRIWNATTGKPCSPVFDCMGTFMSAAFTPDGSKVVTASLGGATRVWHVSTGRPAGAPIGDRGAEFVAISPDGLSIATPNGDDTGQVWSLSTGEPLSAPLRHRAFVVHASFSPDGKSVVTASLDQTARVWDSLTGEPRTPPWTTKLKSGTQYSVRMESVS